MTEHPITPSPELVEQWFLGARAMPVDGSLRVRYGKMCYCKEPVEFYAYEDQPHEIEAREQEETLYLEYMKEKNPVPVPQVAQFFPNRLQQAV